MNKFQSKQNIRTETGLLHLQINLLRYQFDHPYFNGIQRIFDNRTLDNPTVLTSDTFFGDHSNINPLKNYSIIRLFEIRHYFVANSTVGLSNILCTSFC